MANNEQVAIRSISIKHFRSIVNMNIEIDRLNMFVGLNDVGKSNVLKALNLFFTGDTDYGEKFDFNKDFSQLFPKKSKKAKEIVIKIKFYIPSTYVGHGEYVWEKKWRMNGICKDDIYPAEGGDISPRSKIPNLLRKIVYRYVPAVKSKEYYRVLLIELYKAVSASVDSPLKSSAEDFSATLRGYTSELSELIFDNLKMESRLSLPQNFSDIFETLVFRTAKEGSNLSVPLTLRGDGIQARHIPIILKYIADQNYKQENVRGAVKTFTIWGFEEPENGLELLKAFEMSDEFLKYSKEVQVLMTTHSPAFYAKEAEEGVQIFYVQKNQENEATIVQSNPERRVVDENLGLMPIVSSYIAEQNTRVLELRKLWEDEPLIDVPTIMVEGKTDKMYLEMAIKKSSERLKNMLDSENLRIVAREGVGGTVQVKKWVLAWLQSGNKSRMMAIFDRDMAGENAYEEIVKSELYIEQNNKSNVNVIKLEPSKEIIEIYRANFKIPFEVEHLLGEEIWQRAIESNYVEPRNNLELVSAYQGEVPRDKSIDLLLEEKISNIRIRETIANYNPHKDKKLKFCKMVQKANEEEISNIFDGFYKTIEKIEKYFI